MIDHYIRYLPALCFTHSYSALEAGRALGPAVEEARKLNGSLEQPVFLVTGNGPSFIAPDIPTCEPNVLVLQGFWAQVRCIQTSENMTL